MDREAIYSRTMWDDLRRLADTHGIRWQHKTVVAGGTDAGSIQKSREGALAAVIAAPLRCIHSSVSIGCVSDFEEMLKLTRAYLEFLAETHSPPR
jgi:endoglucanase